MTRVRKREQNVRRAGKARAYAPVVLFYELNKIFRRLRPLLLGEHLKVQRQNVRRLELVFEFAVAVRKYVQIRFRNLFADFKIFFCVVLFA